MYICIFICKINNVSFNILYGPLDSFSSAIRPHSQSIHLTALLSHLTHLIFQILCHLSMKPKLLGESLHLKGVMYFQCRGVVIFRHIWIWKNWLVARKIYPHNSHVSQDSRLFTQLFSLRLLPLGSPSYSSSELEINEPRLMVIVTQYIYIYIYTHIH